jgi:hypothetical protein
MYAEGGSWQQQHSLIVFKEHNFVLLLFLLKLSTPVPTFDGLLLLWLLLLCTLLLLLLPIHCSRHRFTCERCGK